MATTFGWGAFPFQFYDMRTRILIIIGIVGLVIWWYGMQQSERIISLIGVGLVLIGFVGAYWSARNKKGMGFLRRL